MPILRASRPRRELCLLLLLAACGRDVPRDSIASRRAERAARASTPQFDTAVYVARQAGEVRPEAAGVMHLRISARDAQLSVTNAAGQETVAGVVGSDPVQEIPLSHATSVSDEAPVEGAPPSWRAMVMMPVLAGERYLVELFPSSPRRESASIHLSADDRPIVADDVTLDATMGEPALFEVAIGAGDVVVSPQIERIEIVPTCGTSHVIRSGGRADLNAEYEVLESGETGDVHLPPRAADARFRGVTLKTKTRGSLRIVYLGRELASAGMPEGCR